MIEPSDKLRVYEQTTKLILKTMKTMTMTKTMTKTMKLSLTVLREVKSYTPTLYSY